MLLITLLKSVIMHKKCESWIHINCRGNSEISRESGISRWKLACKICDKIKCIILFFNIFKLLFDLCKFKLLLTLCPRFLGIVSKFPVTFLVLLIDLTKPRISLVISYQTIRFLLMDSLIIRGSLVISYPA